MNVFQRDHLQILISTGDIAKASAYLKDCIYSKNINLESTNDLAKLTHLYIRQSRYYEALEQATAIQDLVRIPSFSLLRVLFFAHWLAFCFLFESKIMQKVGRYFPRKFLHFESLCKNDYETLNGILWGVYWQNMKQALKMNIFCLLSAKSEVQKITAAAFLYYTLTFFGYNRIGLLGLNLIIKRSERRGMTDVMRDLLTWLGVAYQMSRMPKACLSTHDKLAEKFPDAEPFHQIISFASRLNMSVAELGPVESAIALEQCFSISFGLKESRNHIQIYGTKACLLALEGRRDEALSYLERAETAKNKNANTLDTAIFHRFAAITFLNLHEPLIAKKHIDRTSQVIRMYAPLMWYKHELARLEAIVNYQLQPGPINCIFHSFKLLFYSFRFLNVVFLFKTFSWIKQYLKFGQVSYWSPSQILEYFKIELAKSKERNSLKSLEKVTLLLTRNILDPSNLDPIVKPETSDLLRKVQSVFPRARVIYSNSLSECLEITRKEGGSPLNL